MCYRPVIHVIIYQIIPIKLCILLTLMLQKIFLDEPTVHQVRHYNVMIFQPQHGVDICHRNTCYLPLIFLLHRMTPVALVMMDLYHLLHHLQFIFNVFQYLSLKVSCTGIRVQVFLNSILYKINLLTIYSINLGGGELQP